MDLLTRVLFEVQTYVIEATPYHALQPVLKSIHADPSKVNIKLLAKTAATSVSHLNPLFRTHLKQSPRLYIRKLRMQMACNMLRNGVLSIKEIAYRTGYPDPLYFSAAFKNEFGVSPRGFRENSVS